MAEFTQKEVMKIISWADAEIDSLLDKKAKATGYKPVFKSEGEDQTDYYAEDKERYDREIEFVRAIREKYEAEVNKTTYKFTASEDKPRTVYNSDPKTGEVK